MEIALGHHPAVMLDMSVKGNDDNLFIVQYKGVLYKEGISLDYLPYKSKIDLSPNSSHEPFKYHTIIAGLENCSNVKWEVVIANKEGVKKNNIIELGTFFSYRKAFDIPKPVICLGPAHKFTVHDGNYEPEGDYELMLKRIERNIDHANANVSQRKAKDKVTTFVFVKN